jgi:DNA-binding ferritin-like protein
MTEDKYAGSQPAQDLSGVKTWVTDNRDTGKDKGSPAPEKSREDYADGKPQRDRVLPLPDGHPEGRTELRPGPPVINAPSDSAGNSNSTSTPMSEFAIPNQPDGKPLHQRPRSSGLPGDEYGHPYIDQSQSTGLKRRVAFEYFDCEEDGELVKVSRRRSVLPPRNRQRQQKGQARRKYRVNYRRTKRKKKVEYKRKIKRVRKRFKHITKRYMKKYHRVKRRFKRFQGGGYSSNRKRQRDYNQEQKKKRKKAMEDLAYFDIDGGVLVEATMTADDRSAVIKKMPVQQKNKMVRERSKGSPDSTKRKNRRKKDKKKKVKLERQKQKWKNKNPSWAKRRGSELTSKKALMQMLLAFLRGVHWSHWTAHWEVKGQPSYGDHLLMERLYNSVEEEIDTLAEKIVGEFGSEAVNQVDQAKYMLQSLMSFSEKDPIKRSLLVEEMAQEFLKSIYNLLDSMNSMSLGLDDFIMSIANSHETNLYLLRQRNNSND